jgi:hypothetical protein
MTASFTPAPFHGRRFHNLSGRPPQRPADVLRWLARRRPKPWPRQVPTRLGEMPTPNVDDGSVRATLVGHSTVLLQSAGLNLLTDPVCSPAHRSSALLGISACALRHSP